MFFKNASRGALLTCNLPKETRHGRDQVFTGYIFGGLPCPPQCTNTGASVSLGSTKAKENDVLKGPSSPIIMAGSLQAFGGSNGTGATADRSVFGWVAIHPLVNLTQPVPSLTR